MALDGVPPARIALMLNARAIDGKGIQRATLDDKVGLHITAYIRNLLCDAGIPWVTCEEIGKKANEMIESSDWLETDTSVVFEKRWSPTELRIVDDPGPALPKER